MITLREVLTETIRENLQVLAQSDNLLGFKGRGASHLQSQTDVKATRCGTGLAIHGRRQLATCIGCLLDYYKGV